MLHGKYLVKDVKGEGFTHNCMIIFILHHIVKR